MLRAPGGELPHGLCGPGVVLDEVGGMEAQSRTKGGDEPEESRRTKVVRVLSIR